MKSNIVFRCHFEVEFSHVKQASEFRVMLHHDHTHTQHSFVNMSTLDHVLCAIKITAGFQEESLRFPV